MGYPTEEGNNDSIVSRIRRTFLPVSSLAVERETAREKESQVLIDRELQLEQIKFQPVVKIQKHPGEILSLRDNLFRSELIAIPVKQYNPSKVPMVGRSTVSVGSKRIMGVPVRNTFAVSVPPVGHEKQLRRFDHVFFNQETGLPIQETQSKTSPVTRLNFIDQIFNWINVLLK